MRNMMKRFLVLFLLFASSAAAQGIRFDTIVVQEGTIGTVTNAVIVPANPQIAFCNFPANAVPCTNKATTYTTNTLGTPCSTSTQIVLTGTTTCIANPDAQGNWGVWAAAGQYAYTITLPGGVNLGPYNVTMGIPSGTTLTLGATSVTTLTASGLITANTGITGTGSVGTLTEAYANLTAFPAACGANQFSTQIAATPGCTQPSAANLTNGTTGSGAVVLATSPTIVTPVLNGAATGTGIQGTDAKLLTSGTVSGAGAALCTDANGGATTSGCSIVITSANLTAQQGNIGATTLVTPGANGFYHFSCYLVLTRAATTSSTLPNCVVGWNDADTATAETASMTQTSTGNTVGLLASSPGNLLNVGSIFAQSGVAITYSTTNYLSSGGTSMQYAIHVRLEGPF